MMVLETVIGVDLGDHDIDLKKNQFISINRQDLVDLCQRYPQCDLQKSYSMLEGKIQEVDVVSYSNRTTIYNLVESEKVAIDIGGRKVEVGYTSGKLNARFLSEMMVILGDFINKFITGEKSTIVPYKKDERLFDVQSKMFFPQILSHYLNSDDINVLIIALNSLKHKKMNY